MTRRSRKATRQLVTVDTTGNLVPGTASRRYGVDVEARWHIVDWPTRPCLVNEIGSQPGCSAKPGLDPGAGVSDIHFTPGNPIGVRGGGQVFF